MLDSPHTKICKDSAIIKSQREWLFADLPSGFFKCMDNLRLADINRSQAFLHNQSLS